MRWKKEVKIIKDEGDSLVLSMNDLKCPVAKEDTYLAEAVQGGITDDEHLKKLIVDHEKSNEIIAGFTLAKFMLDYQDFVEEDKEHYPITY